MALRSGWFAPTPDCETAFHIEQMIVLEEMILAYSEDLIHTDQVERRFQRYDDYSRSHNDRSFLNGGMVLTLHGCEMRCNPVDRRVWELFAEPRTTIRRVTEISDEFLGRLKENLLIEDYADANNAGEVKMSRSRS
jgi:hypothetical protein